MDDRHVDRAMRSLQNTQQANRIPTATNLGPLEDEVATETDEPPDEQHHLHPPSTDANLPTPSWRSFAKTLCPFQHRESLLTQALHFKDAENAIHHEQAAPNVPLSRATTVSTWSSASGTSTAELTSDDGLTSPGLRTSSPSPQLAAASTYSLPPLNSKPADDETHPLPAPAADTISMCSESNDPCREHAVEATLGRKRRIKFACGRKESPESSPPKAAEEQVPSRSGRKCMLKFMCSKRNSPPGEVAASEKPAESRPAVQLSTPSNGSPRRMSGRPHRDSDATVRNDSPKATRKSVGPIACKKYKEDPELGHTAATRFHEFASSEEEVDDWVQESTCHRSRLTINDTLGKENIIRQLGKEAEEEEEALDDEDVIDNDPQNEDDEDEDEDEDEEEDENEEENPSSDREEDSEVEAEEENDQENDTIAHEQHLASDDGFQTDDENGFASTDDESDGDSDYQWWAPGGSTAATSIEHLEHIRPLAHRNTSTSSIGSVGSGHRYRSPYPKKLRRASHSKTGPVNIETNASPDLPDSTDFVCGTLDEDRPLEEAYHSCMEQRRAAKHKAVPQDIDPSFPTSDPELDEEDEDEDDNQAPEESDHAFAPGRLEIHDTEARGRTVAEWRRSSASKQQPPAPKHSSPPKRSTARSPPPPAKHTVHRSPPPPKRTTARSPPPPRRLFGSSPRRLRSPPPLRRLRSPPPSRRTSFDKSSSPPKLQLPAPMRLAQRPQLIRTASLPHTPCHTSTHHRRSGLNPAASLRVDEENDDDTADDWDGAAARTPTVSRTRSRGAIDIVKGLEKKRQLRREKLYQKHCSRAALAGPRDRKLQPGKGAERMRQLGLEVAAYRGRRAGAEAERKETHMLSL
ncbi:MAG: hypothetical protein M1822_006441 [Bathelium mastoideum]|nr:MAG: hypothetical protein M1822_006441 [Bathelium mastoideum]